MLLHVGQELHDSHGAAYSVTAIYRSNPWNVLYEADKSFLNYRYRDRAFYSAANDERLPVLLRGVGNLNDTPSRSADVLRDMVRFEATEVLGLIRCNWLAEPIDLLDLDAADHNDAGSSVRVPVSAFARPYGVSLDRWCADHPAAEPRNLLVRFRWVCECLELVETLHGRDLLLGGLSADDFVVDHHGRICYLGSDRMVRRQQMPRLRQFFPPQRLTPQWSPPEALDPGGWLDARSDLFAWAAFSASMLQQEGEADRTEAATSQSRRIALELLAEFRPDSLRWETGSVKRGRGAGDAVEHWDKAITRCLAPDPSDRPQSVKALYDALPTRPKSRAPRRGWRGLFGR